MIKALGKMKSGEASGLSGIIVEMLKAASDTAHELHLLVTESPSQPIHFDDIICT